MALAWLDKLRGVKPALHRRWVVVDVESSGLDYQRARLLAIAAVAVQVGPGRPRVDLGDSFEVVLQQPESTGGPDKANILLHGIGVGAQRAGVPPRVALEGFLRYLQGAPLVAFHAAFDRTMIERHCKTNALAPPASSWLDLEPLAEVLRPDVKARSLDEWIAAMGVHCAVRHQAAADTLATAELLLKLWPRLVAEAPGVTNGAFHAAQALADQRRWLPR